ncbi:MAG TPA: hypothetical protein VFA71_10400 [Terriglobales bacterium]|nr:hypothetical protein [Terriglobales bacterium]
MPSCERRRGILAPSALSIALVAVFLALPSNASDGKQQDSSTSQTPSSDLHLPSSPNDLVRQAVDNELKQTVGNEKYFYMVRKLSPGSEQTKEYVETDEGAVGRLVAMNGKPLPADQMRKEDIHLQKLATDPETRNKHRKEQLEDEERTSKMLKAMPDAFIFQYDGKEDSPQYGALVRLQFKPNPNFNPPSRETQIYRGMEGTMLIDPAEKRLVKIDAHLTQEVTFGWGIFGRLDKGGKFEVEQSKISPRRWETTKLEMKFTGRILLFKKLNIDEKEVTGDFHPAPPHLSLEEGINVLKQQNPQLAQGQSNVPAAVK